MSYYKYWDENNMYGEVMSQNLRVSDFFKSMNNVVFGKTMENLRKYEISGLVTADSNRIIWYHTHKIFSEYLLAIEMKKRKYS